MGFGHVMVVARGCPKHVPTPIAKADQHLGCNRFALHLCKIQNGITILCESLQHLPMVLLTVDEEIIALTCDFQQFVVCIEIGFALGSTHLDSHMFSNAYI